MRTYDACSNCVLSIMRTKIDHQGTQLMCYAAIVWHGGLGAWVMAFHSTDVFQHSYISNERRDDGAWRHRCPGSVPCSQTGHLGLRHTSICGGLALPYQRLGCCYGPCLSDYTRPCRLPAIRLQVGREALCQVVTLETIREDLLQRSSTSHRKAQRPQGR